MKVIKRIILYTLLAIGALVMVFPFFWMLLSSVKTAAEVNTMPPTFWPADPVFENYAFAFSKAPFGIYFVNSVIVTVACVATTMFTTILAAFAFSRLKFPGRDLLFSLTLSMMMIPFEMLIITNYSTIVGLGLIDTLPALIIPFIFISAGQLVLFRTGGWGRQLDVPLAHHGAYCQARLGYHWPAECHHLLEFFFMVCAGHKQYRSAYAAVWLICFHDIQRHSL